MNMGKKPASPDEMVERFRALPTAAVSDALDRMRLPGSVRGISILRTGKHMRGIVGEPIVFAGVPVSRGDMVVGDVDGLVVIPAGRVAAVLSAAQERQAHEEQLKAQLRAGKTTVELYGLPIRN
jgi:4-hydroxy-4-methyl-2-oxoglutarate aldolase